VDQLNKQRVFLQESRIYSMISDGLQMSVGSMTNKNTHSGVDTLSAGEFLLSILFEFLLGR